MGATDSIMTTTSLGQLVADRRRRARLSQEQLAAVTGVERATISAIEVGRVRQPSPRVINMLAPALRMSVAELLLAMGYALGDDELRFAEARRAALELLDVMERLIIEARRSLDGVRVPESGVTTAEAGQ